MKKNTRLFISLIVAMVVLLAIAWYTWPQGTASIQTSSIRSASTTTPTSTISTAVSATSAPASPYPTPSLGEQVSTLQIGGRTLYVALAENPSQQELGLGNRASLGADQGMLFIFSRDDIHMFWMKDMSFSIDMIWMSDDGTVIYIQPNVAPSTYPTAFGPSGVSRYVLEVPANFAANNGITVGDKAILP